MRSLEMIAHRGFPRCFPENTLIGFDKAIGAGARYLEADVQLSQDREPVLFHDRTLSRVSGLPYAAHQLTVKQLKRISVFEPHRFGNRFRGYRPALLSELVSLLNKHPQVMVYVDIKPAALNRFGVEVVMRSVLDQLAPLEGRAVLLSTVRECLEFGRVQGWGRRALVLSNWAARRAPWIDRLGLEALFCNQWKVPLGAVFDRDDMALAVYDLSQPKQIAVWARRGASFLETFDIERMIQAVNPPGVERYSFPGG